MGGVSCLAATLRGTSANHIFYNHAPLRGGESTRSFANRIGHYHGYVSLQSTPPSSLETEMLLLSLKKLIAMFNSTTDPHGSMRISRQQLVRNEDLQSCSPKEYLLPMTWLPWKWTLPWHTPWMRTQPDFHVGRPWIENWGKLCLDPDPQIVK